MSQRSFCSRELFFGAGTALEDQPVRVFDTAPVGDLDPFFVFKVLVVFKEMFDLLDRDFGGSEQDFMLS